MAYRSYGPHPFRGEDNSDSWWEIADTSDCSECGHPADCLLHQMECLVFYTKDIGWFVTNGDERGGVLQGTGGSYAFHNGSGEWVTLSSSGFSSGTWTFTTSSDWTFTTS